MLKCEVKPEPIVCDVVEKRIVELSEYGLVDTLCQKCKILEHKVKHLETTQQHKVVRHEPITYDINLRIQDYITGEIFRKRDIACFLLL